MNLARQPGRTEGREVSSTIRTTLGNLPNGGNLHRECYIQHILLQEVAPFQDVKQNLTWINYTFNRRVVRQYFLLKLCVHNIIKFTKQDCSSNYTSSTNYNYLTCIFFLIWLSKCNYFWCNNNLERSTLYVKISQISRNGNPRKKLGTGQINAGRIRRTLMLILHWRLLPNHPVFFCSSIFTKNQLFYIQNTLGRDVLKWAT